MGLVRVHKNAPGTREQYVLRGPEHNYLEFSSFKLELLALKWAVSEKFKAYTLGSHSIVYTDHNPLAHLKTANLRRLSSCGLLNLLRLTLKWGTGQVGPTSVVTRTFVRR